MINEITNEIMNEITNEILVKNLIYELEQISLCMHINALKVESRPNFVEILNLCKCCHRHQTNRPSKFEPWIDTKFNNNPFTDCDCKCRHLSRWLCRPSL
jgi:hypothetical protein